MSQVPMTMSGKRKLDEELKHLKTVERPKIIAAIAEARSHGDLSENAEYDAAKNQQAFIEGRIAEIEDRIARALVVDPREVRSHKIVFGATIEVIEQESAEKKTFKIVGTDESDVKSGLLSIESPIARELLGKSAGDTVLIRVPRGDVEYEILSIRYE